MIALLVITDGRTEYIEHTIPSAFANLDGDITERWLYDDSGNPEHRQWLQARFPEFNLIHHPEGRQGFGGAIRAAWSALRDKSAADFVFHLEDDFVFNRPVPLDDMVDILDEEPRIAQIALRRQAWNDDERRAGGVVETNPAAYTQHLGHFHSYLEHDLFWTTNPSLYRRQLILERDWPDGLRSEGVFSFQLRDDGHRFAYLGERSDSPWVHHIGEERAGTGY